MASNLTTLKDLGEDRVVRRLIRLLPPSSSDVLHGAGDDCAVLKVPGIDRLQLLKTDVVTEGIHFLPEEDMSRVGWKALCRAVSDIGAMGGEPAFCVVTLLASPDTRWRRLSQLYRGIHRAAEAFGVSIVGGETGRIDGPMVCNICLTGWVDSEKCVLRSGGKPGDILFVTGHLGGSYKSGKHLDFTPRVVEASWVVSHFRPNAMMDLSDGLSLDGDRLAAASDCSLILEPWNIPITQGCTLSEALNDGEDFELLMAVSPELVRDLQFTWAIRFPTLPLTRIGVLAAKQSDGESTQIVNKRGYDHFQ